MASTAESLPEPAGERNKTPDLTPEEVVEIAKYKEKETDGLFSLASFTALINEYAFGERWISYGDALKALGLKSTADARQKLDEIRAKETEKMRDKLHATQNFTQKVLARLGLHR